jgi:hypothetical protein
MKNTKKTIIFTSSLALFLFACGNEEENTQQDVESPEVEAPTDENEETTEDQGEEVDESNGGEEEAEEEPFDEEEMREYIRSLSDEPDAVDDRALEQLELRGIHENTELYE